MNEEAGFIAALLAEPDDRTAMLVYADWLDDRADPRAEYLRLLAKPRPNQRRLAQLRRTLDGDWVHLIDTRHLRMGCCVRILEGSFAAQEGELTAITADRRNATVRLTFWGRPLDVELPLAMLEQSAIGATPESP
jgi:uncharacterized protein (TIGR02996 family)